MRPRLTARHLFVLVPLIGVAVAAVRPIRDNSFLWHVRAGTEQLDAGEVLRSDPFSFTAGGRGWRTQSWLAELVYAVGERLTDDLAWVGALVAGSAVLTLAVLGVATYRRVPSPAAVAVTLALVGWLALPNLQPRPVVFSYLLLAILVAAMTPRNRWLLPLLFWVWAGVHGSFAFGLVILTLEAVRRRDRGYAPVLAASLGTATLTAHGWGVWEILWRFIDNRGALEFISEWGPPDLTDPARLPYGLVLVAVLAAGVRGRVRLWDLTLVAPVLLYGLSSERALLPAAIVLAPWAAAAWPVTEPTVKREPVALNWAVASLIVVASVAAAVSRNEANPDPERFPVAAAEVLEAGPVFHDDRTGGYLIYAEWPDRRVYFDDRAELYGADFFEEFVDTRAGRIDWQPVFSRHGISQALLPLGTSLEGQLRGAGWRERFLDDEFVVLAE